MEYQNQIKLFVLFFKLKCIQILINLKILIKLSVIHSLCVDEIMRVMVGIIRFYVVLNEYFTAI